MPIDRQAFFAQVRAKLYGGSLPQSAVDGLNAIMDTWEAAPPPPGDLRWLAYMMGTAYHETAKTIGPIAEYGKGKGRPYGQPDPPGSGLIYYGRGLVQLTWRANYLKAQNELGIACVANPDLVLQLQNAVPIMFRGMEEGWFTGKKLGNYFSPTVEDWVNARRIINGLDRADDIAGYSKTFYAALQ